MKKKNSKKRVLTIITMLFIILIVLFATLLIYRNRTSEKRMLKILNDNLSNVNYSYTNEENTKVAYMNNIEKIVYEDGSVSYKDYNNNEAIIIIASEESTAHKIKIESDSNPYYYIYKDYFNNPKYEYKYEGKETIDNNNCYVISFTTKTDKDGELLKRKFWINTELGILEQSETLQVIDKNEKRINFKKYDFHNNKASKSDMTKPSLNGYKNIQFSL